MDVFEGKKGAREGEEFDWNGIEKQTMNVGFGCHRELNSGGGLCVCCMLRYCLVSLAYMDLPR